MCRLVAYAGPELPLDRLMFGGSHSLFRQSWAPRELLSGSVNADGYGIAWLPASATQTTGETGGHLGGRAGTTPAVPPPEPVGAAGRERAFVRIARPEPAWYDPELPDLLATMRSRLAVAALRNATPGIPVDRSGLPPLLFGRWAFVLNGWVPDFRTRHMRALRSGLPDRLYAALEGPSDAETLFLLAVALVEDGGAEPLEALHEVARRVEERIAGGAPAPLTMVLASNDGFVALNASSGGGPCNSLYLARGTEPARGGTLLASEPLDDSGTWEPVGTGGGVVVRADGSVA